MQRTEQEYLNKFLFYTSSHNFVIFTETRGNYGDGKRCFVDAKFFDKKNKSCCIEFKTSQNLKNLKIDQLIKISNFDKYYLLTPQCCFNFTLLTSSNKDKISKIQDLLRSNPFDPLLDKYRVYELVCQNGEKIDLKKYFLNYYFENIFDAIDLKLSNSIVDGIKPCLMSLLYYLVKDHKEKNFTNVSEDMTIETDKRLSDLYKFIFEENKRIKYTQSYVPIPIPYNLSDFFTSEVFLEIVKLIESDKISIDGKTSMSYQEFIYNYFDEFIVFFNSNLLSLTSSQSRSTRRSYSSQDNQRFKENSSFKNECDIIHSIYDIKKGSSALLVSELSLQLTGTSNFSLDCVNYSSLISNRYARVILELYTIALKLNHKFIDQIPSDKYDFDLILSDIILDSTAEKRIFGLLDRTSRNGKALILVQESILFSYRHRALRKELIDRNVLDFVIKSSWESTNSNVKFCWIAINLEKEDKLVTFVDLGIMEMNEMLENHITTHTKETIDIIRNKVEIDYKDNPDIDAYGLKCVDISKLTQENYNFNFTRYITIDPLGFESAMPFKNIFKELESQNVSNINDKGIVVRIRDLSKSQDSNKIVTIPFARNTLRRGMKKIEKDALLIAKVGGDLKPSIFKIDDVQHPIYIDSNILALEIPDSVDKLDSRNNRSLNHLLSELSSDFIQIQLKKYGSGITHSSITKSDIFNKIRLRDIVQNNSALSPLDIDSRLQNEYKLKKKYDDHLKMKDEEIEDLKSTSNRYIKFEKKFDRFIHGVQSDIAGVRTLLSKENPDLIQLKLYFEQIRSQITNIRKIRHDEKIKFETINIYDLILSCFDQKTKLESTNPNYDHYKVCYQGGKGNQNNFNLTINKNTDIDDAWSASSCQINGNKSDLTRCINNVINNAVEWGFKGSEKELNEIMVLIEIDVKDAEYVIIQIMNNGVKMTDLERERLLQDSLKTSSKDPRRGNGIPDIKEIILDHGGEFDIDSGSEIDQKFEDELRLDILVPENEEDFYDNKKTRDDGDLIDPFVFINEMEDNNFTTSYLIRLKIKD